MVHDVFISYSSEDKAVADAICHELEHHEIPCWIAPRDVQPGARYGVEIIRAIANCKLVVLVFSAKSNMSDHVANEVDRAFNEGKTIIPFLIDDSKMNDELEYYLSRKHWLAAYPHYKDHLGQLTLAVAGMLNIKIGKTNESQTKGTETPYQEPRLPELDLHIEIDIDCRMYSFGKLVKELIKNTDNSISLKPGTYKFEFESTDNPEIKQSLRYTALPGTACDLLEIKMTEKPDNNEYFERVSHDRLFDSDNLKEKESVMPHEGDDDGTFCERLARVQNEELKWGFSDITGKVVIPCEWEDADDFCEGLARVQNEEFKWGFVDKTGKLVIPCEWEDAENFCEGRAHVQDGDYDWGYINKKGEFSYDCSEFEFSEGLASIYKNGKNGYIDETGKIVIPCIWDYAENFCGGFAIVAEVIKKNFLGVKKWRYGFVDKAGILITPCKWKYAEDFCDGYAEVEDENGDRGFINKDGEFFNPLTSWGVNTYDFEEGLACVQGNNGKYGYIDKTGKLVIPCKWENAYDFCDGFAQVEDEDGNEWTINKKGERAD